MKFTSEQKTAVIQYILSKTAENRHGLSRTVSENFDISTSTVHKYLNELEEQGVITKTGRDNYALVTEKLSFEYLRSEGEIVSENYIFSNSLEPEITELPDNVKKIWAYAFCEMVNNVIDHSEAEHLCIVIEKNSAFIKVTIADDGVGVFRKLKDYFNLLSTDEAIIELAKGKLTTDNTCHSGEGIFFTSRIMDEFLIYSDKKVFTFNKYRESTLSDIEKDYPFGTVVELTLSNSSKKQLIDVFNTFSDVDNGFTRTNIPMKNIFDSSPISRSQAKRLVSRLEQFKEVEIDFDGIDFMAQGFAHEIFCVFANAHPEIKLIPLNMNENVRKMYRHVTKPTS